jgi:hypothetical protein
MGDLQVASPIIYKGQRRLALQHGTGAKRRPRQGGEVPKCAARGIIKPEPESPDPRGWRTPRNGYGILLPRTSENSSSTHLGE